MFSSKLPPPIKAFSPTFTFDELRSQSSSSTALLPVLTPHETTVITHHGTNETKQSKQIYLRDDGQIDVTKTVVAGLGGPQAAQTTYDDTIPLKVRYPHLKHHFPRPSPEALSETIAETKAMIQAVLAGGEPKSYAETATVNGKTISISTMQEDPLLPAKFKLRKNRVEQAPPPPPMLNKPPSMTQPLTAEERAKWSIPAAVSNWKNPMGFHISLENRLKSIQAKQTEVNIEKFANLTSALDKADAQARTEIAERNARLKQQAEEEQRRKEAELQELAQLTRRKRQGGRHRDGRDEHPHKRHRT
ncbi:pre-mRNA-processing protein 45 [Diutina catenulata]